MTQTEPIGNLILSLKIGEPVQVGDAVFTIQSIHPELPIVVLHVEAPNNYPIWIGQPANLAPDVIFTILHQKSAGNFSVAVEAPKSVEIRRL